MLRYKVVEAFAECRNVDLDGGRGQGGPQRVDIPADVYGSDVLQTGHATIGTPLQETSDGALVCLSGSGVANV